MSYIKITLISIATFILGIVLFLFHNNWIVVFAKPHAIEQSAAKIQKNVPLFYPENGELKKESHTLIWSTDTSVSLQNLVTEWFAFMKQENKLAKKITAQSVAFNERGTEAYISLDMSPLSKQQSTAEKLLIIEALLKTIRTSISSLHTIMLLAHHAPLDDPHLDFSQPMPVTGYSEEQPDITPKNIRINAPFTFIIDPATANRSKGRTIDETFERTLALQTAHLLKKTLSATLPDVTVFIPRITHESIEPFQHTTYTNKPDTGLVISLHFYHKEGPLPHCAIYYYMQHAATDFWKARKGPLTIEPYQQAYRASINESYAYASHLHTHLLPTSNVLTCSVAGIPFKPLIGIINPAIALEIGIKESSDLQNIIPIITQAITDILA